MVVNNYFAVFMGYSDKVFVYKELTASFGE